MPGVNEARILHRLLHEAGLDYTAYEGYDVISFMYSGNDGIIQYGTTVELIAYWRESLISIEMRLAEFDNNEPIMLHPILMQDLLMANYTMNICKFALAPYGISLLVDYDARNLQHEEIESGINSLLTGFELYINILYSWAQYLEESGKLNFTREEERKDYYRGSPSEWIDSQETTKGQVLNVLLGVAKCGATAAVLTGLGVAAGVPATGIGAILAAIASIKH
jgi:hypothetical protein